MLNIESERRKVSSSPQRGDLGRCSEKGLIGDASPTKGGLGMEEPRPEHGWGGGEGWVWSLRP